MVRGVFQIALVLCACAWMSAGDVAHIKTKGKLIGRLASKHHKRGVLSSVPSFKLGHDIPRVTHSVVKPLVVTYPPTATVSAVKVPLSHPLLPRYPVGVGHRVPHLPHPHYGLKFPHHNKAVVPDHYFHHHHHHIAPRPIAPVVPAGPVPVAAPTIAHPVPIPSPPVFVPQPSPLRPPVNIFPPNHVHFRPIVPAAPVFPTAPAPVVAPAFSSFAPQFPYILRAGGAVQQSVFATYPRYPFSNYPAPLIPLSASAFSQIVPHQYLVPQGGASDGVVVEQQGAVPVEPTPPLIPAHGEIPQHGVHLEPHGVHLEPAQPAVHLHPGQPELHFQSAQPGIHLHSEQPDIHLQSIHPGVHLHSAQPELHLQPGVHVHSAQPELHLQPGVHVHGQPDIHLQAAQPGFNLQPVQPDYHLQPGHTDLHLQSGHTDLHLQQGHTDVHLQPGQPEFYFQGGHTDVHLQPQPEYHLQSGQHDYNLQPAQPDYNLQLAQPNYNLQPVQPDYNQPGVLQPTQPTVDSNGWSPVPAQPNDVSHSDHYPNDGHHHFTQEQGNQVFEQHSGSDQQYHDYQNQLQHHIQYQLDQAQYDQHINNQHLGQEYGAPQGQGQGQGGHNDYNFQQPQPAAEYGVPGGAEGRSSEGDGESDSQLYHNHIPLGLQPPIDRPLDHFR